jgi:hypothetical protein
MNFNLKYYKKSKIYKNSTDTVNFDPKTYNAYSYNWWRFVAKIDGKIIFNNYNYSPTTLRHQRYVRKLLYELKIKVDHVVWIKNGIENQSIKELIYESEEYFCHKFLAEKLAAQEKYQRLKERKLIESQKQMIEENES